MGSNQTESKKELKKHTAAIHCSNTLSLLQRKITNALLYHAYKELMEKEEHQISVKQLCRLIGYQGNNHAAIKEALKGLLSTIIEWNLISDDSGNENWTASSIIASVSLEGPACYYAYSPRMKQLLHSPSMFGKIDLVIQAKFRSSYGLALYENCIRYRELPYTKWFDIDLFRKLMGIQAGKYEIFRDFKKRVLDKAIDEVNTYSDLLINLECIREGRKVTKVRFSLKARAKKIRLGNHNPLQLADENALEQSLQRKLLGIYGLSEEQVEELLKGYAPEFIAEKMTLVEKSSSFHEGKIQNLAGYLISAIKQNFQKTQQANKTPALEDAKWKLELATLKRTAEKVKRDYTDYRDTMIQAAIQGLTEIKKQQLMQDFYEFAKANINMVLSLQRGKYTHETVLESPPVKALLRQFALRELDSLSLTSLEEFVLALDETKREAWHRLKSYDPDHAALRFSE